MSGYDFTLAGALLVARSSGALFWPEQSLLCVSDLHLGAPAGTPDGQTSDTLERLDGELEATGAKTVICLGDSFDNAAAAASLTDSEKLWIARMQAGRRWVWIEGNHEFGPVELGGAHLTSLPLSPLTFSHKANAGQFGEVSGHYHPKTKHKAHNRTLTRPCFLYDSDRLVMPAFGTYAGGLRNNEAVLRELMRPEAIAILTGPAPSAAPMERA